MVATRNHPVDFDENATASPAPTTTSSPRKRATRTSNHTAASTSPPPSPTKTRQVTTTSRSSATWAHTPSNLTLIWLAISLPLVIWDTGYVLLRPYSMPGGFLHKPLWTPYDLYGRVDHVYGFKAFEARSGWTAAQGTVNALETAVYLVYLYVVFAYGKAERKQGSGAPAKGALSEVGLGALAERRTLYGRLAAWAVLVGFSTASLTFWKTVLYWLNEAFSGFDNIGHNSPAALLFLWIIPNGAWLVFPLYMMYVYGKEIIDGLETATARKAR